jgi:DNA-binding SARP family transcriptional activator
MFMVADAATDEGGQIEFRLLGPVEAWHGTTSLPLGRPKQVALLVALLLQAPHLVPVDELADCLWGDDPPARPGRAIQVYVSDLRKRLTCRSCRLAGDRLLVARRPGYLVAVESEQVDVYRYERLAEEGRRALAAGQAAQAADLFRAALAMWYGPALADIGSSALYHAEGSRLAEHRLLTLEERIEADLQLGRHEAVVPELRALTIRHPLRERFHAQLMVALYRSGQQANALGAYRDLRQNLQEELGLEPGAELQRLEVAILRADVGLDMHPDYRR